MPFVSDGNGHVENAQGEKMNNADHAQESLVPPRREFPWGIQIGSLKHPKTNELMLAKLPANAGGLVVSYDDGHEQDATELVEFAVASIFAELPINLVDVHVIDFGIKKRFYHISQLEHLRLYRIYHGLTDARKYLEEVEKVSIYRHHNLLSGKIRSISEYNKANAYAEKYSIVIVNLEDYPGDGQSIANFSRILKDSFDAGFYTIILNRQEMADKSVSAERTDFMETIRGAFPEVFLAGGDAQFNLVSNEFTRQLQSLCTRFDLVAAKPETDLDGMVEEIISRVEIDTDGVSDFLSLPIGQTPDGRSTVNFNLGAKSQCYSAFILGMIGTGKTTLLNNLIVRIAENFTSDEVRLYLMDYKEGVEFQIFDTHPNCERIFLDNSDLNAPVVLLEDFVNKINQRSNLFKDPSCVVKDIDQYNEKNPKNRLPHLILVIDEVQNVFKGPNGKRFNELLLDVLRRGRGFGLHLILSTQTLSGYNFSDRELLSQIKLRIAFQLSLESDCEKLLEYGNKEPLRLKRFHFIYNQELGYKPDNVLCRGDSPLNIKECLDAVLARTPPEQILKPQIIVKAAETPKGSVAEKAAKAEDLPSWLTAKTSKSQESDEDKQLDELIKRAEARNKEQEANKGGVEA